MRIHVRPITISLVLAENMCCMCCCKWNQIISTSPIYTLLELEAENMKIENVSYSENPQNMETRHVRARGKRQELEDVCKFQNNRLLRIS